MEDYGYKCLNKLLQFVTTASCRKIFLIDLRRKGAKNSILYNKHPRKYRKIKFGIGDIANISMNDSPFRNGYKSQETLELLAISAKKLSTDR